MPIFLTNLPSHEDRVHLHRCADCADVWVCSRKGCQPWAGEQCGLCADQQFNDYISSGGFARPQEMSK